MTGYRTVAPAVLARLVVVLLVAGALALVLDRPSPPTLRITADFARAGLNLRVGDEVRVRDVPVGTVRSIRIDRHDFSARYVLGVAAGTRVASSTTARIVPKTLFGDKYLALDAAAPGQPVLADGAVIPRSRTEAAVEVQDVFDRLTPALQAIDPTELGGMVSSFAAGLGNGSDLGRLAGGFQVALDTVAQRADDVDTLLVHTAGVAGSLADHTGDLTTAAANFGTLAQALADNSPELARFLAGNAQLLSQAGALMTEEQARIQRITADGLDVLDLVARFPGRIHLFLQGTAGYEVGLRQSTHNGTLLAYIPNLFVDFPYIASSSNAGGGPSVGPQITAKYPAPPQRTIDLSPLTSPASGTADSSGLSQLLAGVSGGGS